MLNHSAEVNASSSPFQVTEDSSVMPTEAGASPAAVAVAGVAVAGVPAAGEAESAGAGAAAGAGAGADAGAGEGGRAAGAGAGAGVETVVLLGMLMTLLGLAQAIGGAGAPPGGPISGPAPGGPIGWFISSCMAIAAFSPMLTMIFFSRS